MASEKHYPPAYYRYREKHKSITIHVDDETKRRIDDLKGNLSYNAFFKQLINNNLSVFDREIKMCKNNTIADMRDDYVFMFKCANCGKNVWIKKDTYAGQKIQEFIEMHDFLCSDCSQKLGKNEL